MCLAIPGKILEITDENTLSRSGRVDFGGVVREVNLAYVPDASADAWVLVHAGFALQTIDEEEAKRTIDEMNELADIGGGYKAAADEEYFGSVETDLPDGKSKDND
jgi:hydrogenase expression/formation protein HypC